jgi:hypothetical protein
MGGERTGIEFCHALQYGTNPAGRQGASRQALQRSDEAQDLKRVGRGGVPGDGLSRARHHQRRPLIDAKQRKLGEEVGSGRSRHPPPEAENSGAAPKISPAFRGRRRVASGLPDQAGR